MSKLLLQIATVADGKSTLLRRSIVETFSGSCILVIHGRCVCAFPSRAIFKYFVSVYDICAASFLLSRTYRLQDAARGGYFGRAKL